MLSYIIRSSSRHSTLNEKSQHTVALTTKKIDFHHPLRQIHVYPRLYVPYSQAQTHMQVIAAAWQGCVWFCAVGRKPASAVQVHMHVVVRRWRKTENFHFHFQLSFIFYAAISLFSHPTMYVCVCVGAFTANCYECVAANYNSQAQCLLDIATRSFNQLVTSISNNCNDALSVISGRRSASPERTRILSYQRPQPIKRVTSAVQPSSTCSCFCI